MLSLPRHSSIIPPNRPRQECDRGAPLHRESRRVVVVFPDPATTMIRAAGKLDDDDIGCIESLMTNAEASLRGPQRLLIDFGSVTGMEPRQATRLVRAYEANRTTLEAVIERAAFVRPPSGVVAAAAFQLPSRLELRAPWAIVTSAEAAAHTLGAELATLLVGLPEVARSLWQKRATEHKHFMVERLRAFIAENLADASLDGAANALGMPKRSLQRSMQRLGTSFRELVWETRLERTKRLLAETDMNLPAISFGVGLQNPQQLRRYFVERTGTTPREYRKHARIASLVAAQAHEREGESENRPVSGFFPSSESRSDAAGGAPRSERSLLRA